MPRLHYRTATVLQLARHAITAPRHVDADGEPADTGPALHFVADWWGGDGLYLASNGCPDLPLWPGEPAGYRLIAEPEGYGDGMLWTDWMDANLGRRYLVQVFPLLRPDPSRLIDQIHAAHTCGFDTFSVDVADAAIRPALIRRRARGRHR